MSSFRRCSGTYSWRYHVTLHTLLCCILIHYNNYLTCKYSTRYTHYNAPTRITIVRRTCTAGCPVFGNQPHSVHCGRRPTLLQYRIEYLYYSRIQLFCGWQSYSVFHSYHSVGDVSSTSHLFIVHVSIHKMLRLRKEFQTTRIGKNNSSCM